MIHQIPQLKVLLDNPPDDPQEYLPRGVSEDEAWQLMINPATGLPLFLPNNPKAAQALRTVLDRELPMEELQDSQDESLDHQIERVLDVLLNTRDAVLSLMDEELGPEMPPQTSKKVRSPSERKALLERSVKMASDMEDYREDQMLKTLQQCAQKYKQENLPQSN